MLQNLRLTFDYSTGKSVSEALIESIDPQYDDRLFLPRKIQTQNMLCIRIVLNAKTKTISVHNMF